MDRRTCSQWPKLSETQRAGATSLPAKVRRQRTWLLQKRLTSIRWLVNHFELGFSKKCFNKMTLGRDACRAEGANKNASAPGEQVGARRHFHPSPIKVQGDLIIAGALEKRLSERKFLETWNDAATSPETTATHLCVSLLSLLLSAAPLAHRTHIEPVPCTDHWRCSSERKEYGPQGSGSAGTQSVRGGGRWL